MNTVFITGANRGIGLQLCREFIKGGWRVLAACREPQHATALQPLEGEQCQLLELDVSNPASISSLQSSLAGQRIDILINNAGVMSIEHDSLEDMDFDAWTRSFEVNTIAPFRMSQALLPNLRQSDQPKIITISSQMGAFSLSFGPDHYAYCTSKTAVSKVMQSLANDLRGEGFIVCPVHPGWVQTEMGGPEAEITTEDSAAGLFRLITTLTPEQSGRFWTWEGHEHDW